MNRILCCHCIMVVLLSCSMLVKSDNKTNITDTSCHQDDTNTQEEVAIKKEPLTPATFWGGLILTKVELENVDSLEPFADEASSNYPENCESMTGLVVYHLGSTRLEAGVYVWCGNKWKGINLNHD